MQFNNVGTSGRALVKLQFKFFKTGFESVKPRSNCDFRVGSASRNLFSGTLSVPCPPQDGHVKGPCCMGLPPQLATFQQIIEAKILLILSVHILAADLHT